MIEYSHIGYSFVKPRYSQIGYRRSGRFSEYGYMTEKPNNVAALRKQRGLSQQALGDLIDAHWVTVSKLERGKMQLTGEWLDRLCEALKVEPGDILKKRADAAKQEVLVAGFILQGAIVEDFEDGARFEPIITDDIDDLASDWYRIIGADLEPFYFDGDMVKVTYYARDELRYLAGRMGAVLLKDGRTFFAIVDAHVKGSTFNIRTAKGQILKGVEVQDIGIITAHLLSYPKKPGKKI